MSGLIGSPEWFHEKAQSLYNQNLAANAEALREEFINSFAPNKLRNMNGEELLEKVFGNDENALIRGLMANEDWRLFGAAGDRKYTGILYHKNSGEWVYNEANRAETIGRTEAIVKAEYVRDILLSCIEILRSHIPFNSIKDYESFNDEVSKVFLYKHVWVLKYYQMLYPQYFPGMYDDKVLERAIQIIGLPYHGKRILNAGELALFIRRCNINNIVFGNVYAGKWGWDDYYPPCESAEKNYEESKNPISVNVDSLYRIEGLQEANETETNNLQPEVDNTVYENPTEWIIPYNCKYYDLKSALTEIKKIDWVQTKMLANARVGDIFYFYASAPVSAIQYKGAVLAEKNKSTIDDSKYNIPPSQGMYDGKCLEIAVFREYTINGLEYKDLTKHGLKSKMMGPNKVKVELGGYLHALDLLQIENDKDRITPSTCSIPFPIKIYEKLDDATELKTISDNKPLDDSYSDEEKEKHAESLSIDELRVIAKKQSTKKPKTKATLTNQIYRDPYIAEYARKRANGICQLCNQKAPFNRTNGEPYLESHHIVWLSEGGADSIENTVALCPNCHRKMHVVKDENDIKYLKNVNGNLN